MSRQHLECYLSLAKKDSPSPEQPISELGKSECCQSTFLAKKRFFQEETERAISFPAALDGDCSLRKALGRSPQLSLAYEPLEYHFAN
jgi:hypothetical protein